MKNEKQSGLCSCQQHLTPPQYNFGAKRSQKLTQQQAESPRVFCHRLPLPRVTGSEQHLSYNSSMWCCRKSDSAVDIAAKGLEKELASNGEALKTVSDRQRSLHGWQSISSRIASMLTVLLVGALSLLAYRFGVKHVMFHRKVHLAIACCLVVIVSSCCEQPVIPVMHLLPLRFAGFVRNCKLDSIVEDEQAYRKCSKTS